MNAVNVLKWVGMFGIIVIGIKSIYEIAINHNYDPYNGTFEQNILILVSILSLFALPLLWYLEKKLI